MDIIIHWGVLRYLRKEVNAKAPIVVTAIILDSVVLGAFLWLKATSDQLIIYVGLISMILIFIGEKWFLKTKNISF